MENPRKRVGEAVDFDKGLYKKAIKSWDIARADGETIKFTRNGKVFTPEEVRSRTFMPGRPANELTPTRY